MKTLTKEMEMINPKSQLHWVKNKESTRSTVSHYKATETSGVLAQNSGKGLRHSLWALLEPRKITKALVEVRTYKTGQQQFLKEKVSS